MPAGHRGTRVLPIKETQRPGKEPRICCELGQNYYSATESEASLLLSRLGLETLRPIPQHLAVKQQPVLGSLQPPTGPPSVVRHVNE